MNTATTQCWCGEWITQPGTHCDKHRTPDETPTRPSELPWQNGFRRVKTGSVEYDAFVAMGYIIIEQGGEDTILVKDRRHDIVPSRWARRSEDKTRIKARTMAHNEYLAACEGMGCPGLDFASFCDVLAYYDRAKGEK